MTEDEEILGRSEGLRRVYIIYLRTLNKPEFDAEDRRTARLEVLKARNGLENFIESLARKELDTKNKKSKL